MGLEENEHSSANSGVSLTYMLSQLRSPFISIESRILKKYEKLTRILMKLHLIPMMKLKQEEKLKMHGRERCLFFIHWTLYELLLFVMF